LIKNVAVAAQSMTWVLYIAKNDTKNFTYKWVESHDKRMKTLYSELAAAQAVLASFDKTLYEKTKILVSRVYSFDAQLAGKAKVINDSERESHPDLFMQKVEDLGTLWERVYKFSKEIPDEFANMLDIQPEESNQV